jgi:hypothetical protein
MDHGVIHSVYTFDGESLFASLAAEPGPPPQVALARWRLFRGGRAGCGDFRTLRFDPLPAARRELEEVAELWRQGGREGAIFLAGGQRGGLEGAAAPQAHVAPGAPRLLPGGPLPLGPGEERCGGRDRADMSHRFATCDRISHLPK